MHPRFVVSRDQSNMSLLRGVGWLRLVVTLQYIYVYILPASVCAKIEGDYKSTHKTYINKFIILVSLLVHPFKFILSIY